MRTLLIVFWALAVSWAFSSCVPDIPLANLQSQYTNGASRVFPFQGMPVHYRDEGSGPTVLLLHGTSSSLHTWDAWTTAMNQAGFRVIRLDLPAFGLTGPHPTHDYSNDMYLELFDSLRQHCQVDKWSVVGNSLGGYLSWHYALESPEAIDKLILVDPAGAPRPDSLTKKTPLVFRLARRKVIGNALAKMTPKSMIRGNLEEVYYNDSLVTDDLVELYYAMLRRAGNREAFLARARTPRNTSRWGELSNLNLPTLIMWGAADEWIPVEDASTFQSQIPNSRLIIYPKLGHVPMEEAPMETVSDALAFLRE